LATSVAPPPPEEVRVELYPELPLVIRFQITDAGDPTLGLSLVGNLPGIGKLKAARSLGLLGVTGQSAGFSTSKLAIDWGSVSLNGSFTQLSGDGLRFLWDGTEIGGTELLLTDTGKGFAASWEWETATLRLVSVGVETYSVNEIQFTGRLSESFSLAAILATANTHSGPSSAFNIKPRISNDLMSGYLEFGNVSPYFAHKAESTTFGLGLSFGATGSPLTGGFSTTRGETLTDAGPPQVFTAEQSFQATASISPNHQMSLALKLNWEEKESDDTPKTTEEGSSSVSLTFNHMLGGRRSWSLGSSFSHAWDDVAGTDFLTTGLELTAEAPLGQMTFGGALSLKEIMNLITGTIDETSSSFSLSCALPQVPFAPTIKLSATDGESSLSADLSWVDVTGWELAASLSMPLIAGGGFSSTLEFTFPIVIPFFGPTYGIIRGHVFIDKNKNGILDPGEEGVPGLLLSANGQEAITGTNGRFVFSSLLPDHYWVKIAEMPFGLSPLCKLPIAETLVAGQQVELLIPMESKSVISGVVFHDLDQDGRRDAGEPGVAGVQVLIANPGSQNRTTTDGAGRFSVVAQPGIYTVELVVTSLSERFDPTTPTQVQVLVKERASVQVQFGAYQHPREIIFGAQAPTARFNHAPKTPSVGERVTFDATASEAAKGEIVSYNWEFRKGPTVHQASGREVTVIFDEAGTWLVKLKVTDSNGRTGQSQAVVTVR